ncbi:hypothetical protein QTJ16_006046 [Diplocarpon rosae]|uniref:Uncharacterized protein n=1 Tax=Diplocarpon rosae TaxID=946125 RepID=A0AAD9SXC8_9HELO|nr:hypothetical protein QTJ16_006046 [Diplocarpon rosae]PBP23468.1 hypothetical protein BUE80_DR005609 [Diplocarpon rosae]
MLITSGQISIAFSSAVVFLFTTALFLSGYVLQQATVRDLRAAIKPQLERSLPRPDLFLPPQFNKEGYLVDMVKIETQPIRDDVGGELLEEVSTAQNGSEESNVEEDEQATKDTSLNMVGATRWQKAARKKKIDNEKSRPAEAAQESNVVSIPAESPEEEGTIKPQPGPKPVSAAERRRRIREQIISQGEGESFKGYRRRMW